MGIYNNPIHSFFQAVFTDKTMIEQKLGELDTLASQIEPSLDDNDARTLRETLANLRSHFTQVAENADQKEKDLTDGVEKWAQFQVYTLKMYMYFIL